MVTEKEITVTLKSGRRVIVTWDNCTSRTIEGLTIYRELPDGGRGPDITERVEADIRDYSTVAEAIDDYYERDYD